MRIVIYHDSYGCDTGCCGHYFEGHAHRVYAGGGDATAFRTGEEIDGSGS